MWPIFALGSALAFCFVSVCDKRLISYHFRGVPPLCLWCGVSGMLYGSILLAILGIPAGLPWTTAAAPVASGILMGCSVVLLFRGLRLMEASRAVAIAQTNPIFVALLAMTFLDERISPFQWGGISLVVAGAILISIRLFQDTPRPRTTPRTPTPGPTLNPTSPAATNPAVSNPVSGDATSPAIPGQVPAPAASASSPAVSAASSGQVSAPAASNPVPAAASRQASGTAVSRPESAVASDAATSPAVPRQASSTAVSGTESAVASDTTSGTASSPAVSNPMPTAATSPAASAPKSGAASEQASAPPASNPTPAAATSPAAPGQASDTAASRPESAAASDRTSSPAVSNPMPTAASSPAASTPKSGAGSGQASRPTSDTPAPRPPASRTSAQPDRPAAWHGPALLLVSAMCAGSSFVVAKAALNAGIPTLTVFAMQQTVVGAVFFAAGLTGGPRLLTAIRQPRVLALLIFGESLMPALSILLTVHAYSLGPASLVAAMLATRPLFVFAASTLLSRMRWHLLDENLTPSALCIKGISIVMIVCGAGALSLG